MSVRSILYKRLPGALALGFILSPLSSHSAFAIEEWRFGAEASAAYGPIDGYTQIPLGGKPGTAELERPTYEELSIDNQDLYDLELSAKRGDYRIYAGWQILRPSSSGVLKSDLTTRAKDFRAGEKFDVDIRLDWLRFGIEKTWSISEQLDIRALAELISFDFEYDFSGESAAVNRAIQRAGARIGIAAAYQVSGRLSFEGAASASIPDSSLPLISVVEGTVHWQLSEDYSAAKTSVFLGIGYEYIDYERDQEFTNHVRAELGPLVTVGVATLF